MYLFCSIILINLCLYKNFKNYIIINMHNFHKKTNIHTLYITQHEQNKKITRFFSHHRFFVKKKI